jgi:hypothetical protein
VNRDRKISDENITTLRERGLIGADEIAYYSGDLIVAENVITQARRVLKEASSIISESRRILKG